MAFVLFLLSSRAWQSPKLLQANSVDKMKATKVRCTKIHRKSLLARADVGTNLFSELTDFNNWKISCDNLSLLGILVGKFKFCVLSRLKGTANIWLSHCPKSIISSSLIQKTWTKRNDKTLKCGEHFIEWILNVFVGIVRRLCGSWVLPRQKRRNESFFFAKWQNNILWQCEELFSRNKQFFWSRKPFMPLHENNLQIYFNHFCHSIEVIWMH